MPPLPQSTHEVAIVGAGFGGLCVAMKLKAAGIHDFVVLDKNPEVGGTWYENTYPGAACDVESHLYSYAFAPNPGWSRRFAPGPEIRGYLADLVREKGVTPHLRLGARVVSARFEDGAWRLETADGGRVRARMLVAACGQLNRPALPAIPGLADFAGPCFHSARWPAGFDPAGQVVAVVGTGASAIQIVPALAGRAAGLVLFQRSGAWVLPKGDRAISGLERRLAARVPAAMRLRRAALALRNEGRGIAFVRHPWMLGAVAWQARRALARGVRDPAKRRALEPNYRLGCKRVLVSDDWYAAVDRDDVAIVSDAIVRIEAEGLVTADGRLHRADAIVLATGFDAANPLERLNVVGRDGLALNEAWREGPRAHKGVTVPGFPNLFLIYGPNTNLGHDSIVAMIEAAADYVVAAARHLRARPDRALSVRAEVAAAFDAHLAERLGRTIWSASCRSWYKRADGRITNNWPGLVSGFRALLRRFEPGEFEAPAEDAPVLRGRGEGRGEGHAS